VRLRPHPRFRREGDDLYLELPVAPWEAALGATVPVATLTGTAQVRLPAGSSSGRRLRLRGRGLPKQAELAMLARQAGVRLSLVRRYLAFGLFDPCAGTNEAPLFASSCAGRLAKAERLRRDLGLNYAGAVLGCELLDRIRELEDQVR